MNTHQAIRARRSVREFAPDPIPEKSFQLLKDALRYAPSACNIQPWRFIFVTDENLRREVGRLCRGQTWIAAAPLIVVGCGFADKAYKKMGGSWNSVEVDVTIALDHLTLAAAAEGLGTCWIGAFDEAALKPVLRVPESAKIIALLPVGYPRTPGLLDSPAPANRKTEAEIFRANFFE